MNWMKCPTCGSENVAVDYDYLKEHEGISVNSDRVILLCDCKKCLTNWNAVYEFDCNEEIEEW